MHKLLERQISEARGRSRRPLDMQRLLGLVSACYEDLDRERRRADRSINLVSEELLEANRRTREQQERRVHAILENIVEAILTVGEDGIIESCNPAAERIFGYPTLEMVGRPLHFLIPEAREPGCREFLNQRLKRRRAAARGAALGDVKGRRMEGDPFNVALAVSPMSLDYRRVYIVSVRDVTERSRNEDGLRARAEWYRMLVEHAPEAIFLLDVDAKRILDLNETATRLFGHSQEALQHEWPGQFSPPTQPDGSPSTLGFYRYIAPAMAGQTAVFEWTFRCSAGRETPCEVRVNRFPDLRRNLVRVSVADISERKKSEAALRRGLEFERLIGSISANFINLTGGGIDSGIGDALGLIGRFEGVQRCCLYQFLEREDEGPGRVHATHQWCESGAPPGVRALDLDGDLPWLASHVRELGAFQLGDTDELPIEAWREREFFNTQQVRAIAVVPMIGRGTLMGFLTFEALTGEQRWPADDMGRLRLVGDVFVTVLERKRTEHALLEQRERALVTLESIGDAVISTDARGCVDYLNPIAECIVGIDLQVARGAPIQSLFDFVDEVGREPIENPMLKCLREDLSFELTVPHLMVKSDRTEVALQTSVAPIRAGDGTVLGGVMVFHDASRQRRLYNKLSYEASHDVLTGLINRREFENRLSAALACTWKDDLPTHCLLYLDVDRFKEVNDACGHSAGDALLKHIARTLKRVVRASDPIARFGGDEFTILLERCELQLAERLAEQVRAAVENSGFRFDGRELAVSVSIGVAKVSARSNSVAAVLSEVDAACYVAKRAGRNRIHRARVL